MNHLVWFRGAQHIECGQCLFFSDLLITLLILPEPLTLWQSVPPSGKTDDACAVLSQDGCPHCPREFSSVSLGPILTLTWFPRMNVWLSPQLNHNLIRFQETNCVPVQKGSISLVSKETAPCGVESWLQTGREMSVFLQSTGPLSVNVLLCHYLIIN